MLRRSLVLLACLLPAAALPAQEDGAPAPEPDRAADPGPVLSAALLQLRNLEEMAVTAEVEQEPAAGGGAVFGMVVVNGRAVGTGDDFEGRVEAWRGEDDVTVVLSHETLPGFRLFSDGAHPPIREATWRDAPPRVDLLAAELVPLLDRTRFLRHAAEAELRPSRDPATGGWRFEGPVSRDVVDPAPGGAGAVGLTLRVIRCELRLLVSADGRLEHLELEVVRNDPMREMRARGGLRLPGAPGAPAQEKPAHEIEGARTRYRLTPLPGGPSAEARAFRQRMLRLQAAAGREGAADGGD